MLFHVVNICWVPGMEWEHWPREDAWLNWVTQLVVTELDGRPTLRKCVIIPIAQVILAILVKAESFPRMFLPPPWDPVSFLWQCYIHSGHLSTPLLYTKQKQTAFPTGDKEDGSCCLDCVVLGLPVEVSYQDWAAQIISWIWTWKDQ